MRSFKKTLHVLLDKHEMRLDTFQTMAQVAVGIMNQRPLTTVSMDPRDLESLTPAMLLHPGSSPRPSREIIPPSPSTEAVLRETLLKTRALADAFWKRWTAEYVAALQVRTKWLRGSRNFVVNDVVLVVNELVPRDEWKMALVSAIHPAKDGTVRRVSLRDAKGKIFDRDVTKLVLLEAFGEADPTTDDIRGPATETNDNDLDKGAPVADGGGKLPSVGGSACDGTVIKPRRSERLQVKPK